MKLNFVALKSVPYYQSFGNNFNLGKELENIFNKKLKCNDADCFVPSTPSQPIIIEKIEIDTKKNNGLGGIIPGVGAGVVGSGMADAVKSNKENEQHKDIDTDKIIDEIAENNKDTKEDISIEEIDEIDEFDSIDDSENDFEDIDD